VKVKLDENLPAELLDDLRAAGHEADTVRDEALAGAPDAVVRARDDRRVLLTLDKGIADVRAYPPEHHSGIVLFRPGSMGRGTTLAFVRRNLQAVLERDLTGRLVVVTDRGLRIR
jgi:predicted nuclease of predicted toxin-antitoxin system